MACNVVPRRALLYNIVHCLITKTFIRADWCSQKKKITWFFSFLGHLMSNFHSLYLGKLLWNNVCIFELFSFPYFHMRTSDQIETRILPPKTNRKLLTMTIPEIYVWPPLFSDDRLRIPRTKSSHFDTFLSMACLKVKVFEHSLILIFMNKVIQNNLNSCGAF